MYDDIHDLIARDEKEKETAEEAISKLTFMERIRLLDFLVPEIESKLDKVIKAEKGSAFSYCDRFFYKDGVFFTRICSNFYDGITPTISEIALGSEFLLLSDDELDDRIREKIEEEIEDKKNLLNKEEELERELFLKLKEKYGE